MNDLKDKTRIRIRVSEHAVKQFQNRILMNELIDKKQIIEQIKFLFSQAAYVSDNEHGILMRNKELMIEFIVKNNCIVTLFPIMKKGA